MISTRVLTTVLASAVATIGALNAGLAIAATTVDSSDSSSHKALPYNIDKPRDVFTDGARKRLVPGRQDSLYLTGQDLTGVSAQPGGTKGRV